jgi:hypothetical protein
MSQFIAEQLNLWSGIVRSEGITIQE